MAKQTTSNLPSLVDAFVQTVNSQPREPQRLDEVPLFLRENANDSQPEILDGWTSWCIVKRDNSERIEELQNRTGKPFPASFHLLPSQLLVPGVRIWFAVRCAQAGDARRNDEAHAELAADQNLGTTQRDLHVIPAALDAAIRLLEDSTESRTRRRGGIVEAQGTRGQKRRRC
jgi:hypothetical protein